jgi:NAD(P)-dependent dehydrogenase (short-subunit alcohol dehydrogenase family)
VIYETYVVAMRQLRPRKVAIVTGASQGIGARIAAAFARAGHAVVAPSRSIESSDDRDALTVAGNIADADTAERVFVAGSTAT